MNLEDITTPASKPTQERTRESELDERVHELEQENDRLREELQSLKGERLHEGCGGVLRPSHVTCDLCEGKRVITPRSKQRDKTRKRRIEFLRFLARPFHGPNPPREPLCTRDIQSHFVGDEITYAAAHSVMLHLPKSDYVVRLGPRNRFMTWGLTAKGAAFAGLTDLLVFDNPHTSRYYKPSAQTIAMLGLDRVGCDNEGL